MIFLSDFANFKRHKGSKDKKKRISRAVQHHQTVTQQNDDGMSTMAKVKDTRANVRTGVGVVNTVRGTSREIRSWISLANSLKRMAG